mmetsp:Transcript_27546/g.74140  ORF Transcript_27546/g.74140 Transcript_27546/m.74140 type:complete len:212 (-) Transcript_27546:3896-4531(-)
MPWSLHVTTRSGTAGARARGTWRSTRTVRLPLRQKGTSRMRISSQRDTATCGLRTLGTPPQTVPSPSSRTTSGEDGQLWTSSRRAWTGTGVSRSASRRMTASRAFLTPSTTGNSSSACNGCPSLTRLRPATRRSTPSNSSVVSLAATFRTGASASPSALLRPSTGPYPAPHLGVCTWSGVHGGRRSSSLAGTRNSSWEGGTMPCARSLTGS